MVNVAGDSGHRTRRLFARWYTRVALAILGLALVVIVLNFIPTVHDPTEGVFPVTVVNAMGRHIELRMCDDDACRSTVERRIVQPGESFRQNVGPDSAIPFRVLAGDGKRLGCWVLPARSRDGQYTVEIASTVPCSSLR